MTQAPCLPDTEVIYHYDLRYYNCYTLRLLKPSFAEHVAIGISRCCTLTIISKNTGFILTWHPQPNGRTTTEPPSTQDSPMGELNGVLLPPGFLTNVKVTYQRRRRLKHPHVNCSDDYTVDTEQNLHKRLLFGLLCSALCLQIVWLCGLYHLKSPCFIACLKFLMTFK